MKRYLPRALLTLLLLLGLSPPAPGQAFPQLPPVEQIVERLLSDLEFTDSLPDSVIQSFRLAEISYLPDVLRINIHHRESASFYERLSKPAATATCSAYYSEQLDTLAAICAIQGADPAILVAIWYTESSLGMNTGDYLVRDLFLTLTLLEEPGVIEWNIAQALLLEPEREREEVVESITRRSRRKQNWARLELEVLLQLYPPAELTTLRGSWAGAAGIPQFLPSSIQGYGVDWDQDGVVNLHEFGDAAASTANYLSRNGWPNSGNEAQQRQAIWNYNHSQPYVDGVMSLYHGILNRDHAP